MDARWRWYSSGEVAGGMTARQVVLRATGRLGLTRLVLPEDVLPEVRQRRVLLSPMSSQPAEVVV
jgi:hypothetical protein